MHPYDDDDEEDYYYKDNAQNQYEKFFSIDPSVWEKYGEWLSDKTQDKMPYVYIYFQNPLPKKHIIPQIRKEYELHIEQYSDYFLEEPSYYQSLYDILN